MDWQPIETAPKDGTEIILARGDRVSAGNWVTTPPESEQDYLEYWMSNDGGFTDEHPPTHWQPLPEPPSGARGGEG